jgi:RNA polymerase-binding transcription factor DksA
MLLEKRRDIIGDMNGMEAGALGPDRPESGSDISDLGSDNFEQEFTLGLLQSERALLNEINEALARIEEGTYGICLGTRKPIGKARLTARPWTPYSIEYARLIERGVVRPGDLWLEDEDEDDDDEDDLPEDVDDQADDDLDEDLDEDEDDDLDDEDLDEDDEDD